MKRRMSRLAAWMAVLRYRRPKASPNVEWLSSMRRRNRENNPASRASSTVVEEVDRSELTYKALKARSDAFNHAFARNGGYKGYELQAIESLLAQLECAHDAQRTAEQEKVRAMSAHAIEVRQLRGELASLRQQADNWHRIADERATEIVRLQGVSSNR